MGGPKTDCTRASLRFSDLSASSGLGLQGFGYNLAIALLPYEYENSHGNFPWKEIHGIGITTAFLPEAKSVHIVVYSLAADTVTGLQERTRLLSKNELGLAVCIFLLGASAD